MSVITILLLLLADPQVAALFLVDALEVILVYEHVVVSF
jgi:hypothetical protein